ncbi:MAG: radical SAM protein [Candidatus Bathyarchaeota archaeon]|nr:radical SAM protein [Candidatus Bathyarchaeota archaeon]
MKQIAVCQEESVALSAPMLGYLESEAQKTSCARMRKEHTRIDGQVRYGFSRLNIALVSPSNVGCRYCDSNYKSEVASARKALSAIRYAAKSNPDLRTVEISGSGEALASEVTFEVLKKIQREFPYLTRCVATNGLLLPRNLAVLEDLGVGAIKVSVNAVDAKVGAKIYSFVRLNGRTVRGGEAFEVLSLNQLEGIRNAADAGMMVEVDSTYIPKVNSAHLVEVARIVRSLGAYRMNVVPLSEAEAYAGLAAPTSQELRRVCRACEDVCATEVRLYPSPFLGDA